MRCPVCGASAGRPWRTATSPDPVSPPAYRLVRCAGCGSAWIAAGEPLPGHATLYGGGAYGATSRRLDPVIEPLRRLGDRDRLRWVLPLAPGARVFEVGAGDGRLLEALARAGFRAAGNEPSGRYAADCRARGLDVVDDAVEELALDERSVDAVVLWHVLEHLEDPAGVLRRARRWLAPAGVLIVAVPNLDSLQARIGGDRWFHQDVPRHRTQFTARGLACLLERCGFRLRRHSTAILDQSLLGMGQTLLNRLTRETNVLLRVAKRRPVPARDLVVAALSAPFLLPSAAALELGAQFAGRGGSAVVRAVPTEETIR